MIGSAALAALPTGLLTALREASHIVVFTGAGVSSESGIPTFRDALTGLWENFDAEECVFHAKLDTDSKRIWTVIPRQSGH